MLVGKYGFSAICARLFDFGFEKKLDSVCQKADAGAVVTAECHHSGTAVVFLTIVWM